MTNSSGSCPNSIPNCQHASLSRAVWRLLRRARDILKKFQPCENQPTIIKKPTPKRQKLSPYRTQQPPNRHGEEEPSDDAAISNPKPRAKLLSNNWSLKPFSDALFFCGKFNNAGQTLLTLVALNIPIFKQVFYQLDQ